MSKNVLDLPAEIQQLVLKNLNLPAALFRPSYGKHYETNYTSEGLLKDKYRSYWGPGRTKKQNEAVLTLLNLSKTSQFYADLLTPMIYETLVIRPTPASLAFIKSVQQSSKWNFVKHLIVCTAYREVENYEREQENGMSKEDLLRYRKEADIGEGLVLEQNLSRISKLDAATKNLKAELENASRNAAKSSQAREEDRFQTDLADDPYEDFEFDPDPSASIDFEAFGAVLENLPPNLQKLTIDTPTDWFEVFEDGEYLDIFVHETTEELLMNEQANVYRKQIYTIYKALSSQQNLVSLTKSSIANGFELDILNFPPLSCSIFPGATEYPCAKQPSKNSQQKPKAKKGNKQGSEEVNQPDLLLSEVKQSSTRFARLLSLVTSFKISGILWDNGAGWHMNTLEHMQSFTAAMPTFLFNHLSDKCQKFIFEGDKSWILGDYRARFTSMNPLPLDTEGHTVASAYERRHIPMPGFTANACARVKTVEISNVIAGKELLNFYKARVATIETLKLRNCWINATIPYPSDADDDQCRTWAAFLRALAEVSGEKLVLVEMSYDEEDTARMKDDKSRWEEGWELRDDRLSFEISTRTTNRGGRTRSSRSSQQDKEKFWFGYGLIADKYGDLFPNDEAVEESLEAGEDWKAWLELVDMVQSHVKVEQSAA